MRSPPTNTAILFTCWLACPAVYAGPGFDDCSRIVDDAERLACFDRVAQEPHAGNRRSTDSAPDAQSEAEEPASATASDENTTAVAEAEFGVEPRMHSAEKADSKLREIRATVISIDETKSGKRIFMLDNNQVWLEQSTSRRPQVKAGDSVRIKAASLGSYKLFGGSRVSTRVERIR